MDKEFHLIVSHNTRIQCLLNLIRYTDSKDKTRLKNCAIIRIEFSVDGISVKMVYSGELGDSEASKEYKNPYYVETNDEPEVFIPPPRSKKTPQQVEDSIFMDSGDTFEDLEEEEDDIRDAVVGVPPLLEREDRPTVDLTDIKRRGPPLLGDEPGVKRGGMFGFSRNTERGPPKHVSLDYVIPAQYCGPIRDEFKIEGNHVFYLVRHGQAQHNVAKFGNTKYDTSVTGNGMTQAYNAGKALVDIMLKNNEMPILLFVSDLKRTVQTMNQLIVGASVRIETMSKYSPPEMIENLRKIYIKTRVLALQEFIVLPCASEINIIAGEGNCDQINGLSRSRKKLAFENVTSCTAETIKDKDHECYEKNNHRLNWLYYLDFYKGKARSESNVSEQRRHCRDTNMLTNIIEYVGLTPFTFHPEWRFPQPPPPPPGSARSPLPLPPPQPKSRFPMFSKSMFRGRGTRKKRKTRRKKTRK
jgi:broad specificity phosphatase PhoE